MSQDEVKKVSRTSQDVRLRKTQQLAARQSFLGREARQVGSRATFLFACEHARFTPYAMGKHFLPLKERLSYTKGSRTEKQEGKESSESPKKVEKAPLDSRLHKLAFKHHTKNPELDERVLLALHDHISPKDTKGEILEKLQKFYTDQYLADESIDFLIEVAENNEELRKKLVEAKETFNQQFGREIRAGKNISGQARAFSEKGLGSPTALRDLYREVVKNPRSAHDLFEELTEKFTFSDMKDIIDFILHSMGADLNAKGSSIDKKELGSLLNESRTMQAILGLFRFFLQRMSLIQQSFKKGNLPLPPTMNFEALARAFMELIEERYPTPYTLKQGDKSLKISGKTLAQIIVYTQYRDALREVSPKLFKSARHTEDIRVLLLATLSELEEELEEELGENEWDH